MTAAAVRSSRRVLRIRPAGRFGSSSASPRTSGMTATPVSNPDRPRASRGKTIRLNRAIAPAPVPDTGLRSRYHCPAATRSVQWASRSGCPAR
jgi:hypothetical protein